MPDDSKQYLENLEDASAERVKRYKAFREYYDGNHATQLTKRQRAYLQLKYGEEFNANYCPIVVDVLAERLQVTAFGCDGQDEDLWAWWKANRMDHAQGVIHAAGCRDGDAFVLVEWDNDSLRPVFTFEPAFDGTEGMEVHYDPDQRGHILYAVKRWVNGDGAKRLNLYLPDRVEKYVKRDTESESGNWERYEAEGEAWPVPWTDSQNASGEPLGVPVFHFKHRDGGYNYGRSELRDVVPLQNALNKSIIDLVAAADTTAFRIYWMIGDDPSGVEVTPGGWVYSGKPPGGEDGVSVGMFPGENLDHMISFKDNFVMEIARTSRTPMHYFQVGGHRPAEGTLKQEESGLVAKAEKAQVSFGNSWEDVMDMARKLWNTFGGEPLLDEETEINTVWASAEVRVTPTVEEKLEAGVPKEVIWREMGYTAGQIEEMKETDEYQQRQAQAQVMMALASGEDEEG